MPLGLVNKEVFERELTIIHGRGNKPETPIAIRKLIAEEAIAGTSHARLAEQFNISESSVSAYKNGATSTSTYHDKEPELESHNKQVRDEINKSARAKLMEALESIDFRNNKVKPREAAGIARDMSQVMKNVEPEAQAVNQMILVYKPRMKEEDDYETIDVSGEP